MRRAVVPETARRHPNGELAIIVASDGGSKGEGFQRPDSPKSVEL